MDNSLDITDSTDWTDTSLPAFVPLDATLRCQVCKDFFENAVITNCSHTFCSLCIRRCLAAESRCPTCRTSEQDSRLRRNVAVQEITDAFKAARSAALELARRSAVEKEQEDSRPETRGQKRKRQAQEDSSNLPPRRSRRLQSNEQSPQTVAIQDSDEEVEDQEDEIENKADGFICTPTCENSHPGLVHCPGCQKLMKPESVFDHLDRCESEKKENEKSSGSSSRTGTLPRPKKNSPSKSQPSQTRAPARPPPERLPQLTYGLIKDNALRKKLQDLGISSSGSRQLLMRRHTEWLNLWNANCDSTRPKSRKELMGELDAWERSQGGRAIDGGQGSGLAKEVMRKDFDGEGWVKKNKSDFDQLIEDARRKRKTPTSITKSNPATVTEDALNTRIHTTSSSNHDPQGPSTPRTISTSAPSPPSIFSPLKSQRQSFSHTSDPSTTSTSTLADASDRPHHNHQQHLLHLTSRPAATAPTPPKSPVPGFTFSKSLNHSHEDPTASTTPLNPNPIDPYKPTTTTTESTIFPSPIYVPSPSPASAATTAPTPRPHSPVPGFSFDKSQHYLHENVNAPEATSYSHSHSHANTNGAATIHQSPIPPGPSPTEAHRDSRRVPNATENTHGFRHPPPPPLRRASGSESSLPGRLASPEGC